MCNNQPTTRTQVCPCQHCPSLCNISRSCRRSDKPLQDSSPATKLGSLDRGVDQSSLLVHPFSSYLQHAAHHGYLSLPALSFPAQYLQEGLPFCQTAPGQPFGHEPPFIDRGSFEQSYCSDPPFFLMYAHPFPETKPAWFSGSVGKQSLNFFSSHA